MRFYNGWVACPFSQRRWSRVELANLSEAMPSITDLLIDLVIKASPFFFQGAEKAGWLYNDVMGLLPCIHPNRGDKWVVIVWYNGADTWYHYGDSKIGSIVLPLFYLPGEAQFLVFAITLERKWHL